MKKMPGMVCSNHIESDGLWIDRWDSAQKISADAALDKDT